MRFTILSNRLIGASAVFLLLGTGQTVAQDLSLFEPVDNAETVNNPAQRPEGIASNSATEPEFTLVGSSRIGNKVKTTLRTRNGEILVVAGTPDSTMPIPGFGGYMLDNSRARSVSITLPAGVGCVEFNERGVSCEDQNTASLSLATAAPLVVVERNNQADETKSAENSANENETAAQDASNPFAAALRAAAAANEAPEDVVNRRADSQRFQMRRINPEDVPDGMRLVRTPFGDRLIQQ